MSLEFTVWNRDDGTFLTDVEYSNLKEGGRRGEARGKEDFEDMRLTLQETDYGNFLANEPALDPKLIGTRAMQKWVKEFQYFRATATGNLAKFMDYVTYEYMIDNILDLIKAATSSSPGSPVDMDAVMEGVHPLGNLPSAVYKCVLALEDAAEDVHEVYRTVLVDTPVGVYFSTFLTSLVEGKGVASTDDMHATFREVPFSVIESSVKKLYLEDFYRFAESLGGETAAVMCELLRVRADMLTINIAYNSLHTDFSRASMRTTRAALFPAIGYLYPEGADALGRVDDEDSLRRALLAAAPHYVAVWDAAPVDPATGVRDISDAFARQMVSQLELAFEGQFHYAPFYAWVKLKEQEVKNIQWIATCLEHGVYSEVERIIPIFSRAGAAGRVGAAKSK